MVPPGAVTERGFSSARYFSHECEFLICPHRIF
uniref:Uncharacterized protein n=1 Tax=Myoviridae sp. ctoNH1 TaxID=2826695 RepID=A0A8S5QRE8_9CAUD|nr:MAG TPA: hypothetical protein [Myoviridae sp. ctoNH1]